MYRNIEYWYTDFIGSIPVDLDVEKFFKEKLWRLFPGVPKDIYEANFAKEMEERGTVEPGAEEDDDDDEMEANDASNTGQLLNVHLSFPLK